MSSWLRLDSSSLAAGTKGCLDFQHRDCLSSGLMGDSLAPRLGELRSVWLVYDEAPQLGCQREPLGNSLVWEAGIQSQCVVRY